MLGQALSLRVSSSFSCWSGTLSDEGAQILAHAQWISTCSWPRLGGKWPAGAEVGADGMPLLERWEEVDGAESGVRTQGGAELSEVATPPTPPAPPA